MNTYMNPCPKRSKLPPGTQHPSTYSKALNLSRPLHNAEVQPNHPCTTARGTLRVLRRRHPPSPEELASSTSFSRRRSQHCPLLGGVSSGAQSFSLESDGKIAFDAPQGFRVRLDLIEIGNGCIERIHVAEPFRGASVASMSDLLRLRAVTVVERGSDGEVDDFLWLLECVAREGQVLPGLNNQELEYVMGAGACLGVLDRLVLTAVLGANNGAAACGLL
ncbi:hypothetical protein NW761_009439 [Fusarium oxysporum]|nr:hypothetical protein NW763_013781 [Fusarium oxysporum]KAJ4043285.1 hypothetical protein NW758_007413 [Fusarium oxysporum]KAJ4076298.1 hypothetical protein NW756_012830 [Fusarium oxysporum]KAJ4083667.1 hypothetical protein NW761_009439 [Fusarium oxysporum]KAJ4091164.1 hypothetical protein NW769_012780 [Fusarium oxysporum]